MIENNKETLERLILEEEKSYEETVKYLAMLNTLGSERFLSAIRECNQCQSRFSKLEK